MKLQAHRIFYFVFLAAALVPMVLSIQMTGFYQDDFSWFSHVNEIGGDFHRWVSFLSNLGVTRLVTSVIGSFLWSDWLLRHPGAGHSIIFVAHGCTAILVSILLRQMGAGKWLIAWLSLLYYSLSVKNIVCFYLASVQYFWMTIFFLASWIFAAQHLSGGRRARFFYCLSLVFYLASALALEQAYLVGLFFPALLFLSFDARRRVCGGGWLKSYGPYLAHSVISLFLGLHLLTRPVSGYQQSVKDVPILLNQWAGGLWASLAGYYAMIVTEPRLLLGAFLTGKPLYQFNYSNVGIVVWVLAALGGAAYFSGVGCELVWDKQSVSPNRIFTLGAGFLLLTILPFASAVSETIRRMDRVHYLASVGTVLVLAGFFSQGARAWIKNMAWAAICLMLVASAVSNVRTLSMWSRAWEIEQAALASIKEAVAQSPDTKLIYIRSAPSMIGPAYALSMEWGFPNYVKLALQNPKLDIILDEKGVGALPGVDRKELLKPHVLAFRYEETSSHRPALWSLSLQERS